MQFVELLKRVLVGLCLLLGVLFAYQGLGTDFLILNFESLDLYWVPIGIAFMVVGVLIWMIPAS